MGALVVPQTAIELAKRFEGFERRVKRGIEITAVPYVCPAGVGAGVKLVGIGRFETGLGRVATAMGKTLFLSRRCV